MKYKKLTPSQLNIMKTLWDKKEPMIASDFVQLDPSLNLNSVQSALRSLLKKNYIEVSDIVYSGKVLTRRYIPVFPLKIMLLRISTECWKIFYLLIYFFNMWSLKMILK